jgi:DNA-binding NarL/FixJ family response regulator
MALSLCVSTVKHHVIRLLRAVNASSRVGLAKRVCAVLRGQLIEGAVRVDGRLSLRVLRQRLLLSRRLAEVARMMWEEAELRRIAIDLQLRLSTVRQYQRRIYFRLGVSSAVGLVCKIYDGLAHSDEPKNTPRKDPVPCERGRSHRS